MAILACSLAGILAAFPLPHDPGLSSLRVQRNGTCLMVHAAFANADFRAAVAIDLDRDGAIDALELTAAQTTLATDVARAFVLGGANGDDVQQRPRLVDARIAENADVELIYAFPLPDDDCVLRVDFLRQLPHGHRCYAAVLGAGDVIVADALLAPAKATLAVPGLAATASPTGFGQAGAFFVLGIEHILFGFDHLVFLLALLVGCRSWWRIAATITAFTAAHSLTLIAAALGVIALPSSLVEATIASSIVVVAAANLLQRGKAVHRWHYAFAFGLVHGFGFAGVLAELEIGGPHALGPLLTFNVGVEAGQLAFAAVVLPLLQALAKRRCGAAAAAGISVATGVAGLAWLVQRTFG